MKTRDSYSYIIECMYILQLQTKLSVYLIMCVAVSWPTVKAILWLKIGDGASYDNDNHNDAQR